MTSDSASVPTPADAFSLLGHEHRIAILRALLEQLRNRGEYPVSFSTLYDAVDVDDSGKFNYHLDALTGHFLRRTDDGYELRYAGWAIGTAVLAGIYTERGEFGPVDIEGTCPDCGGNSLTGTYREEWLSVSCRDCESALLRYPFPPGGVVDGSVSETMDAFDAYVRSHMQLCHDGVCPSCYDSIEIFLEGEVVPEDVPVACICERCGTRIYPFPGLVALKDSGVQAFCHEHDIPVDGRCWELSAVLADTNDPAGTDSTVAVEIGADGHTLRVEIDDELSVRATERLQ